MGIATPRFTVWLALLAAPGCTLGQGDSDGPSPYDSASLTVASPDGVADGATPVEVAVAGPIGSKLTVVLTGNAGFVMPDEGTTDEKTVFLTDQGGEGAATVRVVATEESEVSVSFKPDPLRTPRSIEFHPVALAAGPGNEVELAPGLVEHQVCVASSSPVGSIATSNLTDEAEGAGTIDGRAELGAAMPADLGCPTEAADPVGWNGYAILSWLTRDGDAEVDLTYRTDSDVPLLSRTVALSGVAFPGYDVTAGSPVSEASFVSVDVTVSYLATGELATAPAPGVTLAQRFIPEPGPDFLGSSSGGASEDAVTDETGEVTLFFDPLATGTYAWFVTLTGEQNVQLDDLVIP